MDRLQEYPRSAYGATALRVRVKRTQPDVRGWGPLAATSTQQAAKTVRVTITRPRDGKTWDPRVMRQLAPLAQLLFDLTSDIGQHVGFEFRGAAEPQGGIGSFFMRDIRESDKPSWHSWNVAFDLMTKGSPRALTWRSVIPPWMVVLWESAGFLWGGRWGNGTTVKYDPHHFEYLYRPEDVAGDMQRARETADRIRRELGITKEETDVTTEQVKLLQTVLKAIGEDPGPIDGKFGPMTEAALGRAITKASALLGAATKVPELEAALAAANAKIEAGRQALA